MKIIKQQLEPVFQSLEPAEIERKMYLYKKHLEEYAKFWILSQGYEPTLQAVSIAFAVRFYHEKSEMYYCMIDSIKKGENNMEAILKVLAFGLSATNAYDKIEKVNAEELIYGKCKEER